MSTTKIAYCFIKLSLMPIKWSVKRLFSASRRNFRKACRFSMPYYQLFTRMIMKAVFEHLYTLFEVYLLFLERLIAH